MCVCAAAGWQCVKTNNNNKTEIENRQRKARRTEREKVSSGSVDKLISHRWCFEPLIFLPLLLLLVTIPHTHTLLQFRLFIRFMRERESARGVWVSVCVLFYICLLNCWLLFVSSSSFVKFIVCVIPLYYATPRHTTRFSHAHCCLLLLSLCFQSHFLLRRVCFSCISQSFRLYISEIV